MGFYLKGIYTTNTHEEIENKARLRWNDIRTKKFEVKISGLAIVGPDILNSESDQQNDNFQEINYKIEDDLLDFSLEFPGTKFAFILVDCWGGYCQYSGFVCKDGQKIIDLSDQIGEAEEQDEQNKILNRLLTEIGIDLGEKGYFEPFTRNFFNGEKNKTQQQTKHISKRVDSAAHNTSTFGKIWSWLTGK